MIDAITHALKSMHREAHEKKMIISSCLVVEFKESKVTEPMISIINYIFLGMN